MTPIGSTSSNIRRAIDVIVQILPLQPPLLGRLRTPKLIRTERHAHDPGVERQRRKDLGQRGHLMARERDADGARRDLEPEQPVARAAPRARRLVGGEPPQQDRDRCAEGQRGRHVEPARCARAADGHDPGHELAGHADEHRHREGGTEVVAAPQVVLERHEQQGRRHETGAEQEPEVAVERQVAERAGTNQVEADRHDEHHVGRPQDGHRGHPGPPRPQHRGVRRRRPGRMAGHHRAVHRPLRCG
jgi:hypothetical protein